ncbi:MAG: hypothetical protein PHP46_05855 [Candidatus Omnitrophica bacterium]|nr:hypothetical protein [Candidatus Omnitrophota bacterium]
MNELKTKAIENLDMKMEGMDADSIRYMVLKNARSFKASWLGLGQALYTVWKDKLYKNWGYQKFESYTSKEIGIKKPTALKLLRSYYFLEREEPGYLKAGAKDDKEAASIPTLDAVDTLRLASKKKVIDREDYAGIRKKVLEDGMDAREVKRDLTQLIRQREELEPDEARRKRREALIKRYITTLKSLREEIKVSKMLPAQIVNDINKLLGRLEAGIDR